MSFFPLIVALAVCDFTAKVRFDTVWMWGKLTNCRGGESNGEWRRVGARWGGYGW